MAIFTKAERRRRSKRMKAYWKNVSAEKRKVHCQRIAESWNDPEVRNNRVTKITNAWRERPPLTKTERARWNRRLRAAMTDKRKKHLSKLNSGPLSVRWNGGRK